MPCLLTESRKQNRVIVCWYLQENLQRDLEFLSVDLTGDETEVSDERRFDDIVTIEE